ncbi:MAG: hypothetical protein HYW89_03610 [Candidatus Sungiibacteriota bacterium]|uniref:Uncharacterized protein n=1 Tax=Candidatus Sungiibacteriota bacterium TaxID=2750080 RepID=A0A7T5RJ42_9BACT|nr:MAG: hypothetical protein HYW89_03610 [Candidatus Sungbacteria bacterium]
MLFVVRNINPEEVEKKLRAAGYGVLFGHKFEFSMDAKTGVSEARLSYLTYMAKAM